MVHVIVDGEHQGIALHPWQGQVEPEMPLLQMDYIGLKSSDLPKQPKDGPHLIQRLSESWLMKRTEFQLCIKQRHVICRQLLRQQQGRFADRLQSTSKPDAILAKIIRDQGYSHNDSSFRLSTSVGPGVTFSAT